MTEQALRVSTFGRFFFFLSEDVPPPECIQPHSTQVDCNEPVHRVGPSVVIVGVARDTRFGTVKDVGHSESGLLRASLLGGERAVKKCVYFRALIFAR